MTKNKNDIEEINNNNFETEIDENLKIKESKDSEEVKELKQQIANEISNVEKIFTDIVYKEENDFNLEDITKKINPNKLKEAMVLSEILGKPVSKKRRNRNRGYRQL